MRPLALALSAALTLMPVAGTAQNVMPPEQIRSILEATKNNWISIRLFDGQDLLYFTHLESWRCGIEAVTFGVNGGEPEFPYNISPCNPDDPFTIPDDAVIYLTAPPNSLETVTVKILYVDGETATETFERAAVQIN